MKYVWSNEQQRFVEAGRRMSEIHYVQPDIAEFRTPGGKHISGRTAWREHLKRSNSIEMGHSDLKRAKEKWDGRQSDFRDKLKAGEKAGVGPRELPDIGPKGELRNEYQMTRLNQEVRNRLDGRPLLERKMLLKLTLETARDLERRK